MGNLMQIQSGIMLSMAGDCIAFNDSASSILSALMTVKVGSNPSVETLLENHCITFTMETDTLDQDAKIALSIGPIDDIADLNAKLALSAGNGTESFFPDTRRSVPEVQTNDIVAELGLVPSENALLVYHDLTANTVGHTPLQPDEYTSKESGGLMFVHKDLYSNEYFCLTALDGLAYFKHITDIEDQNSIKESCGFDEARWYLHQVDVEIEHKVYFLNTAGNCAGPGHSEISVFSDDVTELTDVTEEVCEAAGCQQLTLVEDDPSIGSFHIEEDGQEWMVTPEGMTFSPNNNGSSFIISISTYNNDVLFSPDKPYLVRILSLMIMCLQSNFEVSDDCDSQTVGWTFVLASDETTTQVDDVTTEVDDITTQVDDVTTEVDDVSTESHAALITSCLWLHFMLIVVSVITARTM